MSNHFDRLLIELDEEEAAYQDLLRCTQDEKQAIVALDAEALNRIGRHKADLAVQLRLLAEKRGQTLQVIAENLALPIDALTLRRLSEAAPPPYGGKLRRCRDRLNSLAQLLGEENDHIRRLVNHGLTLIRGSYQLITQLLDASPVYRASGDLQPAGTTGKLHQSDF